MILAGGYAIWYGRWELAVYDGDLSTDPLIDTMEDVRLWIVTFIENVGAGRLIAITVVTVVAVVASSRFARTTPDTSAMPEHPLDSEAELDVASDA